MSIARSNRIYPVDLKPASGIDNWGKWPQDVEPLLKAWNGRHGGHKLSFGGPYMSVFKCPDCERFCVPHRYGAAYLDGEHVCDDCLIERARAA